MPWRRFAFPRFAFPLPAKSVRKKWWSTRSASGLRLAERVGHSHCFRSLFAGAREAASGMAGGENNGRRQRTALAGRRPRNAADRGSRDAAVAEAHRRSVPLHRRRPVDRRARPTSRSGPDRSAVPRSDSRTEPGVSAAGPTVCDPAARAGARPDATAAFRPVLEKLYGGGARPVYRRRRWTCWPWLPIGNRQRERRSTACAGWIRRACCGSWCGADY